MAKEQHTPGPWALVTKDDKYGKELLIVQDTDGDECEVICGAFQTRSGLLLAAAPELLAACKAQHNAIDILLAMLIERDSSFMPSKSVVWPALVLGNAAISKAETA
jgi:hypothetical protein